MTSTEHNDQPPAQQPQGITIKDYGTGDQPAEGEPTWDTTTLQRDFEVLGFEAPYVAVRRRSDGQMGHLEFTHSPRIYWGFLPATGAR